ncbi:hypothetical protein [Promicromonospora kroppenstedtii]|uniref:hypothetical protein n=1 Tax=Promicromonospora kroppenstedtii TaxID=440482 RepID=UPI00146F99DC|nr:hypothetical protein [Promicromonospora kroppenstedtii]
MAMSEWPLYLSRKNRTVLVRVPRTASFLADRDLHDMCDNLQAGAIGTQLKHLRRSEQGRDQWLTATIKLGAEDAEYRLYRAVEVFECLRIFAWNHNGNWHSAVLPTREAVARGRIQAVRPSSSGFFCSRFLISTRGLEIWVHHSVADLLTINAIALFVSSGASFSSACDESEILQPSELARAQTTARARSTTEYWQEFHASPRWVGRDVRATTYRTENWSGSLRIPNRPAYGRLAADSGVSVPSLLMAECTRIAADLCAISAPTVMTVFSNATILRGRKPGACLADDVSFVAPDPAGVRRPEYWSGFHRKVMVAYLNGLYDFAELETAGNYVSLEPNFYRDVTIFVFDARSSEVTSGSAESAPFEISVVPGQPDVASHGALVLSLLHFQITITSTEIAVRCTSRLDKWMVESALSALSRALDGYIS